MRDDKQRTNEQQLKIELLSQWKLEAESRKKEVAKVRLKSYNFQSLSSSSSMVGFCH